MIVPKGGTPDWTKAVTGDADGIVAFENLTAATEYDIYTRVRETANYKAGAAVKTELLTSLYGLEMMDELYVGETITVKPDPADAEGLSYQWYYADVIEEDGGSYITRGAIIEGANSASYTIKPADEGKTLWVEITKNGKELDSATYGPVEKREDEVIPNKYEIDGSNMVLEDGMLSGTGAIVKVEGNQPDGKMYVYIVVNFEREDGTGWAIAGTYPVDEDGVFDFPAITGVADEITDVFVVALDAKVGAEWAGHKIVGPALLTGNE